MSGSRYEITRELTNKKLDLMQDKQLLSERITSLQDSLSSKQHEFLLWEKTYELEKQSKKQDFENEIEKLRTRIKQANDSLKQKESNIDEQINEINKSLEYIKEISKESSSNQE